MSSHRRPVARSCRSAFTLIELLVVISVIALLISILLPALAKARETARMAQCASQIRQLTIASFTYAGDYEDSLPIVANWASGGDLSLWRQLSGYVNFSMTPKVWHDKSIFLCPSDDTQPAAWILNWHGKASYCANVGLIDLPDLDADLDGHRGPRRISSIRQPSSTILLGENHDAQNPVGYMNSRALRTYKAGWTFEYTVQGGTAANDPGKRGYHLSRSSSGGANNWAFVDGHVDAMSYSKTLGPINLWEIEPGKK